MIRTVFHFASAALVIVALVALPGCGGSSPPATQTSAETGHYEGDGHDHSAEKGDHAEHDHQEEAK